MSRLQPRFASLREQSRSALIPYITAGDPHPDFTVELMHALVTVGADVIELGVPFSDPMADGPVIQAACERALAHNVSLKQVLQMVAAFRKHDTDTPIVLMGYLNPIESMGADVFAAAAHAAGVDGVLPVDLAIEEASELAPQLTAAGLDTIFLLAPTTDETRMAQICAQGQGFVYYVSLKGVTGSDRLNVNTLAERVTAIRKHTQLPVAVGFGIRSPADAAAVGQVADAVVVGSALVDLVASHAGDRAQLMREVSGLLARMRQAMDEAKAAPAKKKEQA